MYVSANASDFCSALDIVMRAMPKRSTSEAMKGILMKVQRDSIKLTCTDSILTITTNLNAESDGEWDCLLPGKLLPDFIRMMPPNGIATITSINDKKITVQCGNMQTSLTVLKVKDFPVRKEIEVRDKILISQSDLKELISKVEYAASDENEPRRVLTGMLLEVSDHMIRSMCCNGCQLATKVLEYSVSTVKKSVIIPRKASYEISRLLSSTDDLVELIFGKDSLYMKAENTELFASLIGGEYFKYTKLLEETGTTEVSIPVKSLKQSVDYAALIAKSSGSGVITFNIKDETLTVTASSDTSECRDVIDVLKYGNDIVISFNVNYVSQALKTIDCERVILKFGSPTEKCLIAPKSDPGYIQLMLPVNQ